MGVFNIQSSLLYCVHINTGVSDANFEFLNSLIACAWVKICNNELVLEQFTTPFWQLLKEVFFITNKVLKI